MLTPATVTTRRGNDPAVSTTPIARVDAALDLSTRTVAWLADHPHARQFVGSVWDKLAELERSGQYPGAINALRRVLTQHQPTSAGRCRTCARVTGRRRPFPCIVWHQIRFYLLGLFAGTDRHRQPAGQGSSTVRPHQGVSRSSLGSVTNPPTPELDNRAAQRRPNSAAVEFGELRAPKTSR